MAKLDFSKAASATLGSKRLQNAAEASAKQTVVEIPVSKLKESPLNKDMPMFDLEKLAESIKQHGQQEALLVYRKGEEYEIYAGHRRFRAMRDILGAKKCQCIIKKYPESEEERFLDHFVNNAERRENNFRFWIAEIEAAKATIKHSGFSGSKAETEEKVAELLENKISIPQIRRYEGLRNMVPEFLELGDMGYAASVLYSAVRLSPENQKALAKIIKRETEKNGGEPISREAFAGFLNTMRVEEAKEPVKEEKKVRDYSTRLETLESRFLKAVGRPKTEKDKKAAIESIRRFRLMLDELETTISGER